MTVFFYFTQFHSFIHRFGIELAGISSDGDPKLLSAMIYEMSLPQEDGILVIQDTIHLGGKFKNRLLKPDIILPMGTHRVSINHLKSLVKDVQKSIHGLTQFDVVPEDRMNFDVFEKIVHDRVISALEIYVKNSEATIQYLRVCRNVTSCFLSFDLTPLERIFRMWRGLFFLRIWRKYIQTSKSYNLQDNFVSSNSYSCAEINGKNLITLIKKYRDQNKSEFFLPTIFDSQTCEKIFRQFRSMGTTQFTKVNFSLLELLHMIGRIEVQNDIAYFKLADKEITFPHKRAGKTKIYSLPSDTEINVTISEAKKKAIEDATKFGMICFIDIDEYEFQSRLRFESNDSDEHVEESDDDDSDFLEHETSTMSENIDEKSPLVAVKDADGITRVVRKSTLLWMLTEPVERLSKDRLRRVQINTKKRKID